MRKDMRMENDTWKEWSRHVLAELKRLSDKSDQLDRKLDDRLTQLAVEIAKLKVKASVWGMLGGALPVLIGLLVWLLETRSP